MFKKVMVCAVLLMAQSMVFSVNYTAVQDMYSSKTSFNLTSEADGSVVNFMHSIHLTRFLQKITEEVVIRFSSPDNLATFRRVFNDAITAASKTMDEVENELIIYNNDDSRK